MKKLLQQTLIVMLLLFGATMEINAEIISEEWHDDWKFDTETGVLTINGNGQMRNFNKNFTLISEIKAVSESEFGYEDEIVVKKVIIEEGITQLGQYAFYGESSIEEVVISSTVLNKMRNAFEKCNSLTKLTISEGIVSIPSSMFEGYSTLTEVHLPTTLANIGDKAFYNCPSLKEIHIKDLDAWCDVAIATRHSLCNIKSEEYNPQTGITEVKFGEPRDLVLNGEKVTKFIQEEYPVRRFTFAGTSIEEVELSVTIEQGAFYGCSKLNSVDLSKVNVVVDQAFEYCTNLTDLKIGKECGFYSLQYRYPHQSISYLWTFHGCTSLKNIVLEEGVEILPDFFGPLHSRNYTQGSYRAPQEIESLTIPISLQSIDPNLRFQKAYYENEIAWYNSYYGNIGNEIYIDGKLWQVPTGEVTIPEGVHTINNFKISEKATSVKIPGSVTNISLNAFVNCNELESIYLSSATPANAYAYDEIPAYQNTTLYVPEGSLTAYKEADCWKDFAKIVEYEVTSIGNIKANTNTFEVTPKGIIFTTAKGNIIAVYTTNGTLVEKINDYDGEEISLKKGIYIIHIGEEAIKVIL